RSVLTAAARFQLEIFAAADELDEINQIAARRYNETPAGPALLASNHQLAISCLLALLGIALWSDRRMRRNLAIAAAQRQQLMETAGVVFLTVTAGGEIATWNRHLELALGREQLAGTRLDELLATDDRTA